MQRPPTSHLFLGLALGLLGSACTRGSSFSGPPVFDETEVNDSAYQANDFGVLRPGDHFIIRGNISDLGYDLFDGFRFTAAEPIHVDFQLFSDSAGNDFDVCLYDPFLGTTVDCFQSPYNPEVGGVDVFAGGLDFHLVIESYFGSGGYELEIEVFGLYGASGEEGTETMQAQDKATPRLAGNFDKARGAAKQGADPSRFEAYGAAEDQAQEEGPEVVDEVTLVRLDLETGTRTEAVFLLLEDGSLQPKQ